MTVEGTTQLPQKYIDRVLRPQMGTELARISEENLTAGVVARATVTPENPATSSHNSIEKEPGESAEYKIDRTIDHEPQNNGTKFYRVRWYAYGEEVDRLGPIGNLPRSKVVQYFHSRRLKQPLELSKEIVS